jgi:hypothetical protein
MLIDYLFKSEWSQYLKQNSTHKKSTKGTEYKFSINAESYARRTLTYGGVKPSLQIPLPLYGVMPN